MEPCAIPVLARFAGALLALVAWSTPSAAGSRDLSYGGRLTDSGGVAISGPVDLQIQFFNSSTAGTALLETPLSFPGVALVDGVFQITIPTAVANTGSFMDGSSDTWIEVKDVTNNVTYPRQQMMAAPLALKVPIDTNVLAFDAQGKLGLSPTFQPNKIAGFPVAPTQPSAGQVLAWDGVNSAWKPANMESQVSGTVSGNLTVQGNNSTANKLVLNDKGTNNSVSLKAPDNLSGSVTFTMPSTSGMPGQVMATDGSGNLTWVAGAAISGVAGGDLTGSYPNPMLVQTGIAPGTYTKLRVDNRGRALQGGSLGSNDIPPLNASIINSGFFGVPFGGTGSQSFTNNGVMLGNGTGNLFSTSAGAPFQSLVVPGGGGAPSFSALNLSQPAAVTGILPMNRGGTGVNSTAVFPASGLIVTDDSALTLKNKSLDSPVITNTGSTGAAAISFETVGTKKWALGVVPGSDPNVALANSFYVADKDSNASRLVVNASGNVGIGGAGTSALLEVADYGNLRVSGFASIPNAQGTYLSWNRSGGTGETNFVNHRGQGTGGFTFDNTATGASMTRLMTINSSGNVGIGTMFPMAALHVNGTTNGPTSSYLRNSSNGTSAYTMFALGNDLAQNKLVLFTNSSTRTLDGGADNSTIRTDSGDLHLGAGGGQKMTIQASTGMVGVGTTNPVSRLSVVGSDSIISSQATSLTSWSGLNLYKNDSTLTASFAYGNGSAGIWADQVAIASRNNTAPIVFAVGVTPTEKMRISQSGNVGIGIAAPAALLDVNGTVRSRAGGFQFPDGTILTTAPGSGTVTNQTSTTNINFASDTASSGNSAYNISFSTRGSQRMVVANTGGIGIGTASPVSALDVAGGQSIGTYAGVTSAPANGLIVSGNVGIGTTTPSANLEVNGSIKFSGDSRQISRAPNVIFVPDGRTGCPPTLAANTDIQSYTFSLNRPAAIKVEVDTVAIYTARVDHLLFVDGINVKNQLTAAVNASWQPVHLAWGGILAAGSHTISYRSGQASTTGCGSQWGAMMITVFE